MTYVPPFNAALYALATEAMPAPDGPCCDRIYLQAQHLTIISAFGQSYRKYAEFCGDGNFSINGYLGGFHKARSLSAWRTALNRQMMLYPAPGLDVVEGTRMWITGSEWRTARASIVAAIHRAHDNLMLEQADE